MDEVFWDEEEACFIKVWAGLTYFDRDLLSWACRCPIFREWGRCRHLTRWRPEVTLRVLECYL